MWRAPGRAATVAVTASISRAIAGVCRRDGSETARRLRRRRGWKTSSRKIGARPTAIPVVERHYHFHAGR